MGADVEDMLHQAVLHLVLSSSTPTDFTIQGVAVLRLSKNTSLVMS